MNSNTFCSVGLSCPSSIKLEINCYCGLDRNRLSIQERWRIYPLLHSVNCCLIKKRVSPDNLDILNVSRFTHGYFKQDHSLYPGSLGQVWIHRLNPPDQLGGLN